MAEKFTLFQIEFQVGASLENQDTGEKGNWKDGKKVGENKLKMAFRGHF